MQTCQTRCHRQTSDKYPCHYRRVLRTCRKKLGLTPLFTTFDSLWLSLGSIWNARHNAEICKWLWNCNSILISAGCKTILIKFEWVFAYFLPRLCHFVAANGVCYFKNILGAHYYFKSFGDMLVHASLKNDDCLNVNWFWRILASLMALQIAWMRLLNSLIC